jgi:hypothetical protein
MNKRFSIILLLFALIMFLNSCSQQNGTPEIVRLIATPGEISIQENSTIECIAEDPDGDKLNYSWKSEFGVISGSGKSITWAAPNTEDTYLISCTFQMNRIV